jgi:hypothetical protein
MDVTGGCSPPIDPSILLGQIICYCLSDGQAADLALDQQFMNTRYRARIEENGRPASTAKSATSALSVRNSES